jgi:hypothetical protein
MKGLIWLEQKPHLMLYHSYIGKHVSGPDNLNKIERQMMSKAVCVLFMALLLSCSNPTDSDNNVKAPSDHTVNKSGTLHKTGINDPAANCTSCHGTDLKGGSAGVSCFSCHGKKW